MAIYCAVLVSILLLPFNLEGSVFNSTEESEIDDFITELMECKQYPGVGLAIVKDGEVFTKGYGYRELSSMKPFDADTVSCGGSTGKAFVAVLLAILLSEQNQKGKRLSFHSKIRDISNGEIIFKDETRTSETTILDLLTHRIGMETVDFLLMTGYPDGIADRKILSRRLKYMETVAPFREDFIYNNLMYMIAGYIAEILGGAPFEELMRSRIFRPLNMTSATFMGDLDFNENVARPYDKENGTLLESDEVLYRVHAISPAGTVCGSPRDYSKWLLFLLNSATTADGVRLVDRTMWREIWKGRQYIGDGVERSYSLFKPFPHFRSASSYALAWFRSNYRGHEVMFHSGSYHAYNALAVVHHYARSAFMLTFHGPWPLKFSNDVVPLSYVISDILLNETKWLDASDACSYPTRWRDTNGNGNGTTEREIEYSNLTAENAVPYVGKYGHPLKGEINVYYHEGDLRARIGTIFNITIKYKPDNDTFVLTSEGSFQKVLTMHPTIAKFSELRNKVFYNIIIMNQEETHLFHRNIDFDTVDLTETDASSSSTINLTDIGSINLFCTLVLFLKKI